MKLKPGVKVDGVQPELVLGLMIANSVFIRFGQELTVTSLLDGVHMTGSRHYKGLAADLRTRDLTVPAEDIASSLRTALGDDFDVVLEKTHIHIEFDS